MKTRLLLTVGNGMMGDDGAGVLLCQLAEKSTPANWEVINGGSTPENILYYVRELEPGVVVLFDAADMDLTPGSIRKLPIEKLEDPFFYTTHTLPLTFLIESLQEFVPQVEFIGIQPNIIAFGYPISKPVIESVYALHKNMVDNPETWFLETPIL